MGAYRLRDLVEATGATARAVRYYVQKRLLPRPSGRGTGPVYGEEHLLRLRTIRRLQREKLQLWQIGQRLAKISAAELAVLGRAEDSRDERGSAASELVPDSGRLKAAADARAHFETAAEARARLPGGFEHWQRVTLVPGLELSLRSDAGALVKRLAEEIRARYAL